MSLSLVPHGLRSRLRRSSLGAPPPRVLRALVALLWALPALATAADPGTRLQQADEYTLKSAFLYNFAKFTEWPKESFEDRGSPLVVAVFGQDPFGARLDRAFEGKQVGGREVEIRRFRTLADLTACHLLFVPEGSAEDLDGILGKLPDQGVLVVGESRDFARRGGALNFYVSKSKLRFEANPEEAERRGLKISSKLLKIARIVEGESR